MKFLSILFNIICINSFPLIYYDNKDNICSDDSFGNIAKYLTYDNITYGCTYLCNNNDTILLYNDSHEYCPLDKPYCISLINSYCSESDDVKLFKNISIILVSLLIAIFGLYSKIFKTMFVKNNIVKKSSKKKRKSRSSSKVRISSENN